MRQSQPLSNCTSETIISAAAYLAAGGLVAFPTETVYGLGADACNASAVAKIYSVKDRPSDHPLIIHLGSINRMSDWASDVPEYAISLARNFWPGPMTLILKRSELASDLITGGQETIGVRVPDHEVALALLRAFEQIGGKGVAAPSANRYGRVSPTSAGAVIDELGEYLAAEDLVLDGGKCAVGVESTIIDCTGEIPRILRPGVISGEMIEQITGLPHSFGNEQITIRVSGSLENHYAPTAKVFLDQIPKSGQGFLALEEFKTPPGVTRLASPKSPQEFAQELYSALRAADTLGLSEVVVIQPIGSGISVAIRDRLAKAKFKGF